MRRAAYGGQLGDDVLTFTIFFKHTAHATRLSFKALQTLDQLIASGGGHGCHVYFPITFGDSRSPQNQMLQPIGPQAAALLAAANSDVPESPRTPKTERAFFPCALPQLGHFSSILARLDRTNLSYFTPQSLQIYS
jgi:hypothetical protein